MKPESLWQTRTPSGKLRLIDDAFEGGQSESSADCNKLRLCSALRPAQHTAVLYKRAARRGGTSSGRCKSSVDKRIGKIISNMTYAANSPPPPFGARFLFSFFGCFGLRHAPLTLVDLCLPLIVEPFRMFFPPECFSPPIRRAVRGGKTHGTIR